MWNTGNGFKLFALGIFHHLLKVQAVVGSARLLSVTVFRNYFKIVVFGKLVADFQLPFDGLFSLSVGTVSCIACVYYDDGKGGNKMSCCYANFSASAPAKTEDITNTEHKTGIPAEDFALLDDDDELPF